MPRKPYWREQLPLRLTKAAKYLFCKVQTLGQDINNTSVQRIRIKSHDTFQVAQFVFTRSLYSSKPIPTVFLLARPLSELSRMQPASLAMLSKQPQENKRKEQ